MSKREKKLVYVGFAADIVHHGHLNIVNVAAKLGHVVVRCVCADLC
jgi:glycerol-3-phosphate cytidylyltransferase-like family protein